MKRTWIGVVALAAAVLGGWVLAQDRGPSGDPRPGTTDPEEIIEARRVLMIEVERQMIPVDRFAAGEPADPEAVRSAGAAMEAMLLAFPHLFPAKTNLYEPDVREPATRALPEIWQDFDAFLTLAEASESAAAAMADADGDEALRTAGRSLRASCDACHARFARPYVPPQVTEEDLEFDFESVLPPQQ
ncbi:MAG: cytochrome c [Gammaproteobacteria bacterium]|nr:cytochrome c [Gammaproteobacteria bacterium]